jgi:hypothetical protein
MDNKNFYSWIAPGLLDDVSQKGGPGSGNHGHSGRPGKIGGSSGKSDGLTSSSVDESPKGVRLSGENAHKILTDTIANGGCTFHPSKGVYPTKGSPVGAYPKRCQIIPAKDICEKDIYDYIDKNMDVFTTDSGAHLGTWKNEKDGNIYLDISHVLSRKEACKVAKQNGELAIFDFELGEIPASEYDKYLSEPDEEQKEKKGMSNDPKDKGTAFTLVPTHNATREEIFANVKKFLEGQGVTVKPGDGKQKEESKEDGDETDE